MSSQKNIDLIQEELKKNSDRLAKIENQNLSDRFDKLQDNHTELDKKHAELKGYFAGILLFFTAVTFVAGYNIVQYQKFEVIRDKAHSMFVSYFEDKLADTIDGVRLVQKPGDFQRPLSELGKIKTQLKELQLSDSRFESRAKLAEGLILLVDNKNEEVISEMKQLESHEDGFVVARALTLRAIATIRLNDRNCDPQIRKLLEGAIQRDENVAAARNSMGLCHTDENKPAVLANISGTPNERCEQIFSSTQKALDNYKLAYDLKPTNYNLYRFQNNKVWASLISLNAVLLYNCSEAKFNEIVGSSDTLAFFRDSHKQVDTSKSMEPKSSLIMETEAELYCLETKYARLKKHDSMPNLYKEATKAYFMAVDHGLFEGKSAKEAEDSLNRNDLLQEFKDDKVFMEKLKKLLPPSSGVRPQQQSAQ